jgi:hypothetical protein
MIGTMPVRPVLLAVMLAAPAAGLPAQTGSWGLPERGAAEFERRTHALFVAPPTEDPRLGIRRLIAPGETGAHPWRYRQFRAGLGADGYETPDYDDATWSTGRTPFGDSGQRSPWPRDRRFLDARATFELGRRMPKAAVLQIDHDDVAVVHLNGVEIYRGDRFRRDVTVELGEPALAAFVAGRNLLAVRVENTGGAALFDLGLTVCDRAFREPDAALRLCREDLAAARRTLGELFPPFRAPRFLCEGELDRGLVAPATPPLDLRDLPAFLAFDLTRVRLAGSTSGTAPRMYRFGDLSWRGRAEPPDAAGLQRIEVQFESGEPRVGRDDKRFVERFVRGPQAHSHEIRGSLRIERRFDPDRGAVQHFRARLEGRVEALRGADAGREFELVLDEEWTLQRIRPNRDADFEEAVVEAIRRGVARLEAEIADPRKPVLRNQPQGDRSYNTGRLALALLALLHAEVPHDHPVVQKGMAELRARRLVDTYSTAHAIMAMERYYAPRGELEELRAGTIGRPRERRPSAEDRALLEEWARILLSNVDTRVDRGYLLRFNYTGGPRYDNSVNQYGLLGLYSAHLCGIEIPVTVWQAAANHLIDDQDRAEGRIDLELTTYRQLETRRLGGATSAGARPTRPAGWGYQATVANGVPQPVYGSMTCAGIAGLTICLAGLRDAEVTRTALVGDAERSIQQGFAWLAANFTVHSNASRVHQPYYWVYYYLYGLERACELSGIALINGRDWYFEGALTLLDAQLENGGWPDDHHPDEVMERTAMAILFLKKSSMPVYTQR